MKHDGPTAGAFLSYLHAKFDFWVGSLVFFLTCSLGQERGAFRTLQKDTTQLKSVSNIYAGFRGVHGEVYVKANHWMVIENVRSTQLLPYTALLPANIPNL
jgi:hypothetical protein